MSGINGVVRTVNRKIEKTFCGYFIHVLNVEHQLSLEEAQAIEEERHYVFIRAPQGAQYFLTSNPGIPPLISVGDYVVKDQVIAIAMVMNYYQLSSGTVTDVVVTTVLAAVILNELASPYLARVVLGKAGEIPRWPA